MRTKTAWLTLVIILIALLFAVISFATPAPAPSQVVLPHMTREWSSVLIKEVGREFTKLDRAKDISRFCPRYAELNTEGRILAWAYLANAMIEFESGISKTGLYNTCSSMKESTGQDSIGLFQLSYGDRFCPKKKSEGSLCNVDVNIRCATKLMGYFVNRDEVVASGGYIAYGANAPKGLARYWAVIREADKRRKHKLKEIIARAKKAPGCV